MNVMFYFICMDLVELRGMQNKQNFQNVIFLSTVDIELTTLCLRHWWFIHMTSDELLEIKIYKAMLFYIYSHTKLVSLL